MIRLHSCYPWHAGGAYRHLMNTASPGEGRGEDDECDQTLLDWCATYNCLRNVHVLSLVM